MGIFDRLQSWFRREQIASEDDSVVIIDEESGWGVDSDNPDPTAPQSPEEASYIQVHEPEIERLRRRCAEYFKLAQTIERERDKLWIMYRQQTSEHLNAQALLETKVERLAIRRQIEVNKLLAIVNRMREEKNLPSIKGPADLDDGEPLPKFSGMFSEKMIKLCREFPTLIDANKPSFTTVQEDAT